MTEDGGVAESLNVQLNDSEIAPSFIPEDATVRLGLPANLNAERVFVHKTANYENYIVVREKDVAAITPEVSDDKVSTILSLVDNEKVNDITSVGNTLIVSTTKNLYYILYKNRVYSFLGNKVPFPHINFEGQSRGEVSKSYKTADWDDSPGQYDYKDDFPSSGTWSSAVANGGNKADDKISFWVKKHKELAVQAIASAAQGNKTPYQAVVRYAVQLYDESNLSSIPIVLPYLGGYGTYAHLVSTVVDNILYSYDENMVLTKKHNYSGNSEMVVTSKVEQIFAKLISETSFFSEWSDIITNINIYVSFVPIMEGDFTQMSMVGTQTNTEYQSTPSGVLTNEIVTKKTSGQIFFKFEETYLQRLLNATAPTFLIKSIPILNDAKAGLSKDLNSLIAGSVIDVRKFLDETAQDHVSLYEQDVLGKDDMKHYIQTSKKVDVFNNQLLLVQPAQIIDYDYSRLNAYDKVSHDSSGKPVTYVTYDVTYLLRSYTEDKVVKKQFTYAYSVFADERIYAFQIFPDSRAYKMIVKATIKTSGANGTTEIKYGEFDMLPHPSLDCAYYYGGISTELVTLCKQAEAPDYPTNAIDDMENKLIISEQDNPLYFPVEHRYTFQSKVVGIAIATTALSQGQFGQFPLYVFTEDGIWAMETAADGSFVTSKPLSREVCINPDSITPLDNAVVFVTAQGVMMLQGSQVVNISPNMNGRHYQIENSARTIIENQDFFCDLLPALSDNTHFLAFVKEATVAYDYAGRRLIFIKKDEKYQYIYKLDTQTWHKGAYDVDLVAPINSYPECLVQGKKDGKTRIYDLSTILDAAESKTPVRGVIATRPFDLGEPDVFKTITDVRIRGQFPKGAVKFILLGSNDGINFATVSTLRGRAWKLFRMVILADLAPTERISWVDIMYDTKFTNKLR